MSKVYIVSILYIERNLKERSKCLLCILCILRLRDVSLFSGGERPLFGGGGGRVINFFPLVWERVTFFQGFLREGHNLKKKKFLLRN